jgi:hypothetical protein
MKLHTMFLYLNVDVDVDVDVAPTSFLFFVLFCCASEAGEVVNGADPFSSTSSGSISISLIQH